MYGPPAGIFVAVRPVTATGGVPQSLCLSMPALSRLVELCTVRTMSPLRGSRYSPLTWMRIERIWSVMAELPVSAPLPSMAAV